MKHDLRSWPRRTLIAAIVVAFGAGVTTAALIIGGDDDRGNPPPASIGAQGISLVSYDTCDTALAELKNRILPHVGPYGLDGQGRATKDTPPEQAEEGAAGAAEPGAAPRAPQQDNEQQDSAQPKEHSTTNVHEAGVDEPDLVKTDGKRVVSVADGVLRVVDVASRAQTATVSLEGGYASQLLLAGDRALVMTAPGMVAYDGAEGAEVAPREPTTKPAPTDTVPYGSQLSLVDLTAGTVLGTLSVDGNYLDARQVGTVARVVVRSQPRMEFRYPESGQGSNTSREQNQEIVANSAITDWLPRYELTTAGGATTSGQLTRCADVSHPADYSATGMLTVLTVDLQRDLGTGDPVTIVADGDTVYGTGTSLYVADDHMVHGMTGTPLPGGNRTELYQFDISAPGKPVYVASGSAEGTLLNQYSLSEFDGHLRVATTTNDQSGSQSMITVLARNGEVLTQVGRVEGLGVGERIYAVRYFGDTAYVVTFRQTDPLYTVDLSDPAAPKVTGELKITGYSAYLHPAGDGRLIGVGQEADENGRVQGAQVSLFDTSNPAGATRIAQYHLPDSWSEVESDPHAFLYWPEKGLVVLPMSGTAGSVGGAAVLKLDGNAFEQAGVLSHVSEKYGNTAMPPRRALVIGNELWTVSEAGMLVNDLDSLAQLAWLPFS